MIKEALHKVINNEDLTYEEALETMKEIMTGEASQIQMAVRAGARIIGVNNRNLKDFTVDIHNGIRLREKVPKEILFVAESGIKTRENIVELEKGCVNAVLIGETFMRSENKKQMLQQLKGE